jgi:two-component system, LytTR family, sensor kinase
VIRHAARAPVPRTVSVLVAAASLVPVFALIESLEIVNQQQLEGYATWAPGVFGRLLLPWGLLALCVPLMRPVVARFPLASPLRLHAVLAHAGAALALPLVHVSAMAVLYSAVWGDPVPVRFEWLFSDAYRADVLAFCATAATLHAIRFIRERQHWAEESLRLRAELSEARLAALQSQLQPHFFFNALNSVASLIRVGHSTAAVDALARLSQLIRETLRDRDEDDVSLEEEFAVLCEYLAIERLRFGDRLHIDLALDPAVAAARIPFLLLQPLAENAVRHGVSGRPGASAIRIRAEAGPDCIHISVEEQGEPTPPGGDPGMGLGLGLRNTRARLAARFGPDAALDLTIDPSGRGSTARVRLPLSAGARAATRTTA